MGLAIAEFFNGILQQTTWKFRSFLNQVAYNEWNYSIKQVGSFNI